MKFEKLRGDWQSHGGPPSWGLAAISGCTHMWAAGLLGVLPGGSQRRWVTAHSCRVTQGTRDASSSSCAGGGEGSLSPEQLPSLSPPCFLPSLSHFLHISKLSVMRLTSSQENAVHLFKSLLETILKQKFISARCTSLEKASVCLKSGVLDSAGIMVWLKRVPGYLNLWPMQNLPLPACSTEENNWAKQSVSCFFLSLLSPFG